MEKSTRHSAEELNLENEIALQETISKIATHAAHPA